MNNHNLQPPAAFNRPQSAERAYDQSTGFVVDMELGNRGEGESFDKARIESYADGSSFMVWDEPGQEVEIAPVPREGTSHGWCTAEGDEITVPDIFNVNGGDQQSVVGIQTGLGAKVIIQDGYLYVPAATGREARVYDMNEYFTDQQPVIGQNWIIPRRDGDTSRAIKLGELRKIVVESSRRTEIISGGFENLPAWQHRSQSSGTSVFKHKSNQLRGQ